MTGRPNEIKGLLANWRLRQPIGRRTSDQTNSHDEKGSSLILALAFMVVTSLVVISLAGLATNDLNNTAKFTSAQSLQSAADSATNLAVNSLRYNFMPQTLNASPPQPCWTTGPTPSDVTLNGQSVSVWCSTAWTPLSPNTRLVTFVLRSEPMRSTVAPLTKPVPVMVIVVPPPEGPVTGDMLCTLGGMASNAQLSIVIPMPHVVLHCAVCMEPIGEG